MKRIFLSLLVVLVSLGGVKGAGVQFLLKYCTFSTPENKPYIETYLSILGNTAVFKKSGPGLRQASVEIGISFSQGNTIKAFKKYVLNSPEVRDSAQDPSFLDQQRFPLENGDYLMELTVKDKNDPAAKPYHFSEQIRVDQSPSLLQISGIEPVESYKQSASSSILTKNGYDLVPYVSSAYPANMDKLIFYTEVYHADKVMAPGDKYVIVYYLEQFDNAARLDAFGGYLKTGAQSVTPVLSEISISKLPSGKYNLVVEVHDKDNHISSFQKISFQRINPLTSTPEELAQKARESIGNSFVTRYKNVDSLIDFIRSVKPISSDMEYSLGENDIKTRDVTVLQRRVLIFWSGHNPKDPEAAFLKYQDQVMIVQHSYGTQLMRGYNTDRGRVYLKYGQPNNKTIADKEPSAYPYEIWNYYRLEDGQTNRKFVFYNPDLVTNNYILIHSDARGEVNDYNWSMRIQKRNTQSNNLDEQTAPDHWGGNAVEDFDHPK